MINAVIGGEAFISGLRDDQIRKIKEDLTLPNPRYEQAIKFSRVGAQDIPQTITFYNEPKRGVLQVPRGYPFPKPDKFVYNVSKVPIKWPTPAHSPRDWQKEVLDKWDVSAPHFDYTAKAGPGMGKTYAGLLVAAKMGQRTLVVVHTQAIMKSWIDDCARLFGTEVRPGIWQGKRRDEKPRLIIAMMQTLRNIPVSEWGDKFGMLIVDEAHHCPSLTLFNIVNASHAAYRFGITATPERSDKLDVLIPYLLGPIRSDAETDASAVVPVKVLKLSLPFPLIRPSESRFAELSQPSLHKRQSRSKTRLQALVAVVKCFYRDGQPWLVIAEEKKMVESLTNMINKAGIEAKAFTSDLKPDARIEFINDARKGLIPVTVATSKMLAEGVNVPKWGVALITQTFSSPVLARQLMGRVERACPGKSYGCVIDCVDDHFITQRQWSSRERVWRSDGYCVHRYKVAKVGGQWKLFKRTV